MKISSAASTPPPIRTGRDGLTQVDFGALKQKLLGSIVGIAAVDALAWYFDLENITDTSRLVWVLAFPVTFGIVMVLLALADWLTATRKKDGSDRPRARTCFADPAR